MRFTLHTSDGCGFVIRDRGKVFARGVLANQIRDAIEKRVAGDAWRERLLWMCCQWNGAANQHHKKTFGMDEWDHWSEVRQRS